MRVFEVGTAMARKAGLRIAIYHNLPSGGAKRALFEMVRGLAPEHELHGYSLSCAEHTFADIRPFLSSNYVELFKPRATLRRPFGRLNQLVYLRDLLRLDRLDRALAERIDSAGYDVVLVHHCRYRQSPALLRFLTTPSLYYCQEPPRKLYDPALPRPYARSDQQAPWHVRLDPLPRLYQSTLRRHDRWNAQSATEILVNSYHSYEHVWRVYGLQPVVCYLGVDTEVFHHVPGQKRERLVLAVGSLNAIKGYDLLIRGIACLPPAQRLPLVIISNYGDPDERAYLNHLAASLGVRLALQPMIEESRALARWYSRALVTGFTPMLEPLGLVPLESMACATPVLGVREGGVRETVVDGVTGWLVSRDPQAVGDALADVQEHPEVADAMGQRGRAWVQEHWTWQRCLEVLESRLTRTAHAGA